MKKFEYLVVGMGPMKLMQDQINSLGLHGWEMVGIEQGYIIMKREIKRK